MRVVSHCLFILSQAVICTASIEVRIDICRVQPQNSGEISNRLHTERSQCQSQVQQHAQLAQLTGYEQSVLDRSYLLKLTQLVKGYAPAECRPPMSVIKTPLPHSFTAATMRTNLL